MYHEDLRYSSPRMATREKFRLARHEDGMGKTINSCKLLVLQDWRREDIGACWNQLTGCECTHWIQLAQDTGCWTFVYPKSQEFFPLINCQLLAGCLLGTLRCVVWQKLTDVSENLCSVSHYVPHYTTHRHKIQASVCSVAQGMMNRYWE